MKMLSTKYRKGDMVRSDVNEARPTGVVKEKITRPTRISGRRVMASSNHPEYLVGSKFGTKQNRKTSAMRKQP